jgi:hypothetical protein
VLEDVREYHRDAVRATPSNLAEIGLEVRRRRGAKASCPATSTRTASSVAFLYRFSHPVDGEIELTGNDDTVRLRCRWPLDLETGDYFRASIEFDRSSFIEAVHRLDEDTSVRVSSAASGALGIAVVSDQRLELDIQDTSFGRPQRLIKKVPGTPAALLAALERT